MANFIIKRNGIYYYMRRIPDYISQYDHRKFIRSSLRTRDKKEAIRKSLIFNDYMEDYWKNLIKDNELDPDTEYKLAVKRAKVHGFAYKSVTEISKAPIKDVIKRIATATKTIESPETVSSILGGYNKPLLPLSELWDDYYVFTKPDLIGKTKNQLRKWKNPRIKAFKTFIEICGDISVEEITRDHILTFRAWWADRLQEEGMSPNSPNKDLTNLKSLLAFAQDNKDAKFDVDTLFARIRFKESDSEKKPFKTDFIIKTLLNHDNLKGLNDECKFFLFAFADTGARPSELVGLNSDAGDIRLDTDIPYIYIRPEKTKEIKNRYSKRKIPLVGASLYAFKQLNGGFKHYYQNPDLLSACLNKYLREHNLLPSENHTAYSLRHSFEDRLTAVEPPDKVQAALMGHRYDRPRYGDGPSLEQKHKWLQKIAFNI